MPEFKRMTPAEIAASRKKIQELMGKTKKPAREEPGKMQFKQPRTETELRNELRQCNVLLTHAINTNNEPSKRQLIEKITILRRELHSKKP